MSKIGHNGGPAFPNASLDINEGFSALDGGMSLRDYAAIHADLSSVEFNSVEIMASFLGEEEADCDDLEARFELAFRAMAKLRYMAADAMLAAREEGGDA